jgi:hypothetical protein
MRTHVFRFLSTTVLARVQVPGTVGSMEAKRDESELTLVRTVHVQTLKVEST